MLKSLPLLKLRVGNEIVFDSLVLVTRTKFVIEERFVHTRAWNLKAAPGPKPCKVKQPDRHIRTFKQHELAKKVPNNPEAEKSQFSAI